MHSAGIKRQAADALSRLPTSGANATPFENNFLLLAIKARVNTENVIHFVDTVCDAVNQFDAMGIPSDKLHSMGDTLTKPTTNGSIREQARK